MPPATPLSLPAVVVFLLNEIICPPCLDPVWVKGSPLSLLLIVRAGVGWGAGWLWGLARERERELGTDGHACPLHTLSPQQKKKDLDHSNSCKSVI